MNEKPSFKKSINQIPLPIGKIKKNPGKENSQTEQTNDKRSGLSQQVSFLLI
jgi:hypothetical protein